MIDFIKIRKAIQEENLSGWLFFNFRHRDPISDRFLEIEKKSINSRSWFYIIFADSDPIKIVHAVESSALDHLPGGKKVYTSRKELSLILSEFKGEKIAVNGDRNLTTLSYMDTGTGETITSAGIITCSAAPLIQKTSGLLDTEQLQSHINAACHLYSIIGNTWQIVRDSFINSRQLTEKDLEVYINSCFEKADLVTEHQILVAFGKNTADPHYETGKKDSILKRETLVQFDIWAREKNRNSVYADISWVGFTGEKVPDQYSSVFEVLTCSRDFAVDLIKTHLESGKMITGEHVDSKVRKMIEESDYLPAVKHRTGHAIDIELHGYGVNLDSVEFPDSRSIISGSCFSIEPGLYFEDFGMRTEINCYIKENIIHISGGTPQTKLLTL